MGIKAESMNIQLDGAKVEVTKVMVSDPRRIGKIIVHATMPALNLDEKTIEILERVGRTCPVERSLHPDVELDIQFKLLLIVVAFVQAYLQVIPLHCKNLLV
jgi:putative redox protein